MTRKVRRSRIRDRIRPAGEWKTLCQPRSKGLGFFQSGKAAKGGEWAPPFISYASVDWPLTPTASSHGNI